MKSFNPICLILTGILISFFLPLSEQSVVATSSAKSFNRDRRDGNWWKDESRLERLSYMTGFFDGMDLGNALTSRGLPKGNCSFSSFQAYQKQLEKYFNNVTNGQLVDGLDEFYKDYRNQRLLVYDATWLVLNEIAGTPRAQMDKMIETYRKNAAL